MGLTPFILVDGDAPGEGFDDNFVGVAGAGDCAAVDAVVGGAVFADVAPVAAISVAVLV